ncbi:hypothetical protein [Microbacterium yannicii]|nr:hypothetical protein [Microbacterium yannicii]
MHEHIEKLIAVLSGARREGARIPRRRRPRHARSTYVAARREPGMQFAH